MGQRDVVYARQVDIEEDKVRLPDLDLGIGLRSIFCRLGNLVPKG